MPEAVLVIIINPNGKLPCYKIFFWEKSFHHDLSSLDLFFMPAGTSSHPQKERFQHQTIF